MVRRDDIRNLEDMLVLINEKCGHPKVVADVGELSKNINQENKSGVLQACRCPLHSVINAIGKTISSISIWNIVNQLGKYNFSCRPVVNKLEDQINRNRFDLILARLYWNCPTIENLRCLNFDANEII